MRIKKAKYIFLVPALLLFAMSVFSRGNHNAAASAGMGLLFAGDSLSGDSVGYVPENEPLVIDSAGGIEGEIVPEAETDTIDRERKPFLDDIISGTNKDSLVYDVRNGTVHIYEQGSVDYQDKNLQGDYMRVDLTGEEKIVYAHGRYDSVQDITTRPVFSQDGTDYEMDTMRYNLTTGYGNMRGLYTQEGEGYLSGARVKKMPDNIINIADGKYTTCDAEHPHFYIAMTKAKAIPGKKVIVGPSYLVMEDVPIPFLGIPFGFFPLSSGRTSGFIMPAYGEETTKGFFIRNGGYYFTFKDYADLALTAGIYTYGSWEANASARYMKRYKYSGSFSVDYAKNIVGEKGSADYVNSTAMQIRWNHSQDARARPGSTFSASVNFSTSGYNKYSAQSLNDYLSTQTNSSIAYSRTWAGTPFSFSTNMQHSQNSRDSTMSLSFPNMVFSVSRITPFKKKDYVGKAKWYHKITLQYTGTLANQVNSVKERDMFTDKMFKSMKNGVNHVIPVSASFNLLKYVNITPSANYRERWYFQKVSQEWDPVQQRAMTGDTTYGFYRVYDYNISAGLSTKLYMTYSPRGKDKTVQKYPQVRHVITPTVNFSYTPAFNKYYEQVQRDTLGNMTTYSPYTGSMYGVPGNTKSAMISFGLQQTVQMKVKSDRDSTGVRKINLIDNLSITSSYNFVLDSLNLSPFNISFRTNVAKNVGLNLSMVLDPYQINERGQKINKFMLSDGKLGRITSISTSFGYTFRSSQSNRPVMNDVTSEGKFSTEQTDFFSQPGFSELDAAEQRRIMSSKYYDFSIPWNFGFNYSFNYSKPGHTATITQTLGFNFSVNLTPKWGITISNAGYDFQQKKITPFSVNMTRDLHCWQMSFSWVPIGFRKSWSFNIGVSSSMLKDLKYDRNSSFYDNLYDF